MCKYNRAYKIGQTYKRSIIPPLVDPRIDLTFTTSCTNRHSIADVRVYAKASGGRTYRFMGITNRRGEVSFRISPGAYDFYATNPTCVPEVPHLVNATVEANRNYHATYRLNQVLFLLHVDANRDGYVDDASQALNQSDNNWTWGGFGRGAIIPVNVDQDNTLANHPGDQDDQVVNGQSDLDSDVGKIEVRCHGNTPSIPRGWSARLQVLPTDRDRDAHKNVRIFNRFSRTAREIIGPQTRDTVDFSALLSTNRAALGMEGCFYADRYFNGFVKVRLSIECPSTSVRGVVARYFTEAKIRVASWIMPNHLDAANRVYVSDIGNANLQFRDDLWNIVRPARCNMSEIASNDRWMQDCMEIGYSTWPGAAGTLQSMTSVMRALRHRPLQSVPKTLRNADTGYIYPGVGVVNDTTYDSTGNLEVTPPVRSQSGNVYPWGRIYYGPGERGYAFNRETREFLESQTVQAPIELETSWLEVGHVDEMMTFIPCNSLDRYKRWKLLIACPQTAYDILDRAPGDSVMMKGRRLSGVNVETTVTNMLSRNRSPFHVPGNRSRVFTWSGIRQLNRGIVQPCIENVLDTLVQRIGLDKTRDVIRVPVIFKPERPSLNHRYSFGALTADMVNMLVVNNHLAIPTPFGPIGARDVGYDVGNDLFAQDLDGKIRGANRNLTISFIDDWDVYHSHKGEVHCGTNTLRIPQHPAQWWTY